VTVSLPSARTRLHSSALAANAKSAQAILDKGADYLLAVKSNLSALRAEIERAFASAARASTHSSISTRAMYASSSAASASSPRSTDWSKGAFRASCACRGPRPSFDLAEILGPGHRPAQDDQQDLGRRIDDLPGSARVLEGGKMVEKAGLGHRGPR
jgi:hypothetical protein